MKRISAVVVAILLVVSGCIGMVSATETMETEVRASPTISDYYVSLAPGTSSGEIWVSYHVGASKLPTSVGVSSIEILNSDGSHAWSITGTVGNGLINNSGQSLHAGSYPYFGKAGASYFAAVTVFVATKDDYDSRTIVTPVVKAP
ncbi:hypothetical protein [Pseudoflavonifractor sp. 524-17]|uniref:hypothetical protein n=1 Tax=Pseudoflavonifractor sp. 524-17 TaxID=2304577 RepID=UPI00137B0156|nr:hypothetical protein [Pseudoflavonifractor sp. 524-17]